MRTRHLIFATALLALSAAGAAAQRPERVRVEAPRRGWLGISYDYAPAPAGGRRLLVITDVVDDSPAQHAGLLEGDTLLRVNNLNATAEFMMTLGSALEPGDTVAVRVRRGGSEREFNVQAAERPAQYAVLPPDSRVIVIDPDSLRGKLRIIIDSVMTRIDSLDIPRVYVQRRRGEPGAFQYFVLPRDSMIHMDSVRLRALPFFYRDSMRLRIDTVWNRMLPRTFEFHMDSMFRLHSDSVWRGMRGMRFDTLRGGRYLIEPGFSGVAMFGVRAIAGAELTELSPGLAEYFGVDKGVLVVRVPSGTPAQRTGLQEGDVIVRANGRDVSSTGELRSAVVRAGSSQPVQLEVVRKNQRITLELKRE